MRTSNYGWQVKSLGEIADIVTGGTPSTAIKEYWEGGDIPWLNSGELNQGMVTSSSNYITQLGLKNSVAKLMPPDTILIALTGATTGRIGYLTFEACANQSVTGIIPSANHDPKFLYYHLQTLRENILKIAWGGAQKHINQKFVKDLKIPLPPLPIQKQIAEILEKADQAKQKRKEANKLTDEFLQSLFIEMFGDPVKNPQGWDKIKLGDIISFLMDYHSNGSYETLRNNVKLLDTPDYAYMVRTTDLEKQDYETDVKYVSKSSYEFLKKSKIFGGEIIINKIGSAGQVYLMPYLNRKVSLGMNQFGLRFNDKANNIYIYFLLKSSYGESIIKKKVQGAVTKTITKEAVRSLVIPLPPLPLQQQFAELVNKTEGLKEKQKQSEQELENLFQSLMQRAFKGELVS